MYSGSIKYPIPSQFGLMIFVNSQKPQIHGKVANLS